MKRRTKVIIILLVLVLFGGVTYTVMSSNGSSRSSDVATVEVIRGDLVDKALAVGRLEPEVEVSVKSQISGVVSRRFADVGDFVRSGTPLIEIRPTPTPQELVDGRRQIELRELELANLRLEYDRQRALKEKHLISAQEFENVERRYQEASIQLDMAKERLALLQEGRVVSGQGTVETIIRAPISGYIIDKNVEIGDPIVPLTSYQEGTVLMTMADMETLILRGTVDEIDVGRLQEGMPVEIKIGALPETDLRGSLSRIWLKARKEEGSTVFPVEIRLDVSGPSSVIDEGETPVVAAQLRAGYSANAEIIIERRENVLVIPERIITFNGDSAKVKILLADGTQEERAVSVGLSDAINIEVVEGLSEGDRVVEPAVRKL